MNRITLRSGFSSLADCSVQLREFRHRSCRRDYSSSTCEKSVEKRGQWSLLVLSSEPFNFHAIRSYLEERKSPYKAIVAFSGERDFGGVKVSEASLNGFPSSAIADKIEEHPYRFLVCADKFQTGYDEPLLHTMYVDKVGDWQRYDERGAHAPLVQV